MKLSEATKAIHEYLRSDSDIGAAYMRPNRNELAKYRALAIAADFYDGDELRAELKRIYAEESV